MSLPLIWIVTDQLPYPPRNGITLPLYHYLSLLSRQYGVRLVLLTDSDAPPGAEAVRENEALFGPVLQIALRRCGKLARIHGELRGVEMYQHGWAIDRRADLDDLTNAAALIVSPMSAVAKWRVAAAGFSAFGGVKIAAVNDCTTAEYFCRRSFTKKGKLSALKANVDYLRSKRIGAIEHSLLAQYDHVLLQTKRDFELMEELVSAEIASKVQVIPNGVSESYLEIERRPKNQVVFVGELSGEYSATAEWLLTEVWPQVVKQQAGAELLFVGRGASEPLRMLMQRTPAVAYVDYVKNLGEVYGAALVALSPVFKGFGLINKTLEAMASGLPVVGGAAAFNGIIGFRNGTHGVVCGDHSAADFSSALIRLIADEPLRNQIGAQARQLVRGQFSWSTGAARLGRLATG